MNINIIFLGIVLILIILIIYKLYGSEQFNVYKFINKPNFPSGYYRIQQAINSRYLDAYERPQGNAVTRTLQNNDTQIWYLEEITPSYYTIQQKKSGLYLTQDRYLDQKLPIKNSLDKVILMPRKSCLRQIWKLERSQFNEFRITPAAKPDHDKYLDAQTVSSANHEVILRDYQDNETQLWQFKPISWLNQ